jgi:hypothetical protein
MGASPVLNRELTVLRATHRRTYCSKDGAVSPHGREVSALRSDDSTGLETASWTVSETCFRGDRSDIWQCLDPRGLRRPYQCVQEESALVLDDEVARTCTAT